MSTERRIFDRLRVFVSSRMIEMREERKAVRVALDELKVDAWVFELCDAMPHAVGRRERRQREKEKAPSHTQGLTIGIP